MKLNDSEDAITEGELETFLSSNEVNVPDSYKSLILDQNGGWPDDNLFIRPSDSSYFVVHEFYSIKNGDLTVDHILDNFRSLNRPDDLVPFACDEGGNHYCFKTSVNNSPVYIYYVDGAGDGPEEVASSFDDLINNLQPNEDVEYDF